jgi:hypothetical protein
MKNNLDSGKHGTILGDMLTLIASLDDLYSLVISVHGGSSYLASHVQYIKATTQYSLTRAVKSVPFSLMPDAILDDWISSNLSSSIDSLRNANSILMSMKSFVSDSELRFLSSEADASQFEMQTCVTNSLSAIKVELSRQSGYIAVLKQENVLTDNTSEVSTATVVDKYLFETKPEDPLVSSDFSIPSLTEALYSVNSAASSYLTGSKERSECDCLSSAFLALRLSGSPIDQAESLSIIATGTVNFAKAIEEGLFESAKLTGYALADLTLRSDPALAWKYLTWCQGVSVRSWLYSVWTAALNPSSEVFASLIRLESLKQATVTTATEKRRFAEEAFLMHTSTCYRRLDVSNDPTDLAASIPATSAVLSIQFDPYLKNIYISLKKAGESNEDAFIFEKISFSNEMNHSLGELKARHKLWINKVQRMVTQFSESLSTDHDIAADRFVYNDSRLESHERNIEIAIETLLSELQALFHSALGPGSRIGSYFQEHANNSSCALILDPSLYDLPWEGLPYFSYY